MNTLLNVITQPFLTPHGKQELQGGECRLLHHSMVQSKTVSMKKVHSSQSEIMQTAYNFFYYK